MVFFLETGMKEPHQFVIDFNTMYYYKPPAGPRQRHDIQKFAIPGHKQLKRA